MTTITATSIATGFDRKWDDEAHRSVRTPITHEVKVGDFLSEDLVTDSIVYEVVKVTAKTVTLRTTNRGISKVHEDKHCDKGAHGLSVVWEEQVSNPEGATYTLRVRKDGTIRMGDHTGARPLYPSNTIEGKPARRVDHRF